jgi:hypothetical protein
MERLPGHRHGHVQAAGADRQHTQGTGRRRVAVCAKQDFAGFSKALHVHRVADPVPRAAIPQAEALAGRLQEKVIVGILEIGLDQVVVHVLDRDVRLDALETQGFQFQHHQRAGGVLGQGLVDAQADFLAGDHFP